MILGEEVGVTNSNCCYYYTINAYDWIVLDYIIIGYTLPQLLVSQKGKFNEFYSIIWPGL
jgi:hypothetical protein